MNGDEGCPTAAGNPQAARAWIVTGLLATLAAAASLVASRGGPMLSPDSMTYLATADHLRRGLGFTDFTGEAMAVFGPVYPLVLTPGGTSLGWIRATGALAAAATVALVHVLARRRVRPVVAAAAAAMVALGATSVSVSATAWSETMYVAIGLGMLLVLTGGHLTARRCACAGALAGLGFLTRYAGVGLVLTGAVVVGVALFGSSTSDRRGRGRNQLRTAGAFVGAAALVVAPWIVRNLVETGTALGPRFSGGAPDSLSTLLRLPVIALGWVVTGETGDTGLIMTSGRLAVAGIAVAWIAVAVRAVRARRLPATFDIGVIVLAATCVVVPVVARAVTANDIEQRVMSPTFTALVLLAALATEAGLRVRRPPVRWVAATLAVLALAGSAWRGLVTVNDFPDRLWASSANRDVYSPQLHDAIDALPADVHLLTNNPQRTWWQNRREPTRFAFTRPRAGNSHYPLDADELLHLSCDGPTVLAWFPGLLNAGDGPEERRPDLLEVVRLTTRLEVAGGTLYDVTPLDPAGCADPST